MLVAQTGEGVTVERGEDVLNLWETCYTLWLVLGEALTCSLSRLASDV